MLEGADTRRNGPEAVRTGDTRDQAVENWEIGRESGQAVIADVWKQRSDPSATEAFISLCNILLTGGLEAENISQSVSTKDSIPHIGDHPHYLWRQRFLIEFVKASQVR